MSSFEVDTNEYKNLNFCSIFSLICAYNFIKNKDISKKQHEKNLKVSKLNYVSEDFKKDIDFEKLLSYSNLDNYYLNFTNPELIKNNIISYEHMLLNDSKCIIFLKNFNFFVVLHTDDNKYCVRDCHSKIQYNFNNKNELINYLNNKYSFNKWNIINNYIVEEMSNIEFIILKNEFDIKFKIKSWEKYKKKKCLEEDNGISVYFNKFKNIPPLEFYELNDNIDFFDIFKNY